MSSSHDPSAELLIPADTPVHNLAPQCKILATGLFVLAVACTPKEIYWPYLGYGLLLAVIVVVAQLPPLTMVRRLVIEVPFLIFVVALPFLADGPHVEVLGVGLSESGLHSAAAICLKASFGLLATGVLAATTPLPDIITGLERLRVPKVFTGVASFMVRYTDVLLTELARLRTARACRGADPRWIWQIRDTAACIGAVLVRAFERGERVYLAMASRGYSTGGIAGPAAVTGTAAPPLAWTAALAVPFVAAVILGGAVVA